LPAPSFTARSWNAPRTCRRARLPKNWSRSCVVICVVARPGDAHRRGRQTLDTLASGLATSIARPGHARNYVGCNETVDPPGVAWAMDTTTATDDRHLGSAVGHLLRGWRSARGMSQLDLAMRAGFSARHVSFIETGRTQPSRQALL